MEIKMEMDGWTHNVMVIFFTFRYYAIFTSHCNLLTVFFFM